MYLNTITLAGWLAADVTLKEDGTVVKTTFRLIVQRPGNRRGMTVWIEAYGETALNVSQYLKAGSGVIVQGEIVVYNWKVKQTMKWKSLTRVRAHRISYLRKALPGEVSVQDMNDREKEFENYDDLAEEPSDGSTQD